MIVHLVVAWCLASAPARDPQAKAGEAAFAEQRWDEASAAFDAAYRNTGDAAFLYARAQAERRAGRCKLAIVLYEQFVAENPSDKRSLGLFFRIAANYEAAFELDRGIDYYDRILRHRCV